MKTSKLKWMKLKSRDESGREIALFMVVAALCGWMFPGLWNLIIVHYGHRGLSKFESRFFSLNQYEVLAIFIIMAGFAGWLFSLFFRKRRWEAGILCGVVFFLISWISRTWYGF